MILFLFGKDTFRSRQQLHKMMEKFKADRDPGGMNIVRLDCEKMTEQGSVMQEILTTPFLSEKRMVVLENALISKSKELQSALLERIESARIPESTVLLFWEGTDVFKIKEAKGLFERLQKEKYVYSFEILTGAKLTGWIAAEVAARGGKIETSAAQYLAQHVGTDMWRLNSLIDQLLSYVSSTSSHQDPTPFRGLRQPGPPSAPPYKWRVVTLADVQLFVDERADDNIFNLVDAILGKQPKKVFAMIEEQYKKGEDSGYIFAMILRQCRILLELREMFERDDAMTSDVMAKKLNLHPFVVKKSFSLVKRYSRAALERMYEELLTIDIQTKTGQGDRQILVDLFVGRVSVA